MRCYFKWRCLHMQGDVSRRASALQAEAARLRDRKDMSDEERLNLLTERCPPDY